MRAEKQYEDLVQGLLRVGRKQGQGWKAKQITFFFGRQSQVTQSLWVAGMIKFIEKKTKTRKQGKNPESRFCGEETCAQSIRSTARRVERICGRESEKERRIFTGHLHRGGWAGV